MFGLLLANLRRHGLRTLLTVLAVSGLVPALAASRLDPIEALRRE